MDLLKFNIYAMVKPSTPEEYRLCLDEALREMDNLGKQIDKLLIELEDKNHDSE